MPKIKRKPTSRLGLLLALGALLGTMVLVSTMVTRHAASLAAEKGLTGDRTDLYVFSGAYVLTLNLLASLPMLMVVSYRGLRGDALADRVAEDLALCGLSDQHLRVRMQEYEDRNGFSAFLLPLVVNLILLTVTWAAVLIPHGISGMLDTLRTDQTMDVSVALMLPKVAADASPVIWSMLGAYFYSLSLLVRRWTQSDLTTGVIWRIDVRLVAALIVGLLLTRLASGQEKELSELGPWVSAFAFLIGITPDVFLRWVSQSVQRVIKVDDSDLTGLFAPSELQRRIPGLGFWQVDRLADEGVETVRDLAMKEIPELLIRTRFDTPVVLSWVDRALLANQVGAQQDRFDDARVLSATALVALAADETARKGLLRSLDQPATIASDDEGESPASPAVTADQLNNILTGLRHGPNLRTLQHYWASLNARITSLPRHAADGRDGAGRAGEKSA